VKGLAFFDHVQKSSLLTHSVQKISVNQEAFFLSDISEELNFLNYPLEKI